jgi:hypothetical protein
MLAAAIGARAASGSCRATYSAEPPSFLRTTVNRSKRSTTVSTRGSSCPSAITKLVGSACACSYSFIVSSTRSVHWCIAGCRTHYDSLQLGTGQAETLVERPDLFVHVPEKQLVLSDPLLPFIILRARIRLARDAGRHPLLSTTT